MRFEVLKLLLLLKIKRLVSQFQEILDLKWDHEMGEGICSWPWYRLCCGNHHHHFLQLVGPLNHIFPSLFWSPQIAASVQMILKS